MRFGGLCLWLLAFLVTTASRPMTAGGDRKVWLRTGAIDITPGMLASGSRARHFTTLDSGSRVRLKPPAGISRERATLSAAVGSVSKGHLQQWLVHLKGPVSPKAEDEVVRSRNSVVHPTRGVKGQALTNPPAG